MTFLHLATGLFVSYRSINENKKMLFSHTYAKKCTPLFSLVHIEDTDISSLAYSVHLYR